MTLKLTVTMMATVTAFGIGVPGVVVVPLKSVISVVAARALAVAVPLAQADSGNLAHSQ